MTLRQYFTLILCLIGFNARGEQVSLSLKTNTVSLGANIILTCTVDGVKKIDKQTTRQWSMGENDELLCYNGRINNIKKYEEKVLQTNKFSLTIFNVTKSDLNIVYQCRYGFDAARKLIEADESQTFLSLILVTDVIIFGGYIILTCAIHGISKVDKDVTRQWSMGNEDQLLSYNGRINNHGKFKETLFPGNEFSLKIFNVTAEDVNITYRCRYGFDTASLFIELNEYNYVNPPTPASTTVKYFLDKQMDTINISVNFKRVFPIPICSVNINATKFDITDLRKHEVDMDVNLSLSLQRRVACSRSFNISCHFARKQYDVGYLKPKDECSTKGQFDATIILLIILISIGVLILILVLVRIKRLVLDVRENKKEDTTCAKDKNQTDRKTVLSEDEEENKQIDDNMESEKFIIVSKANDSNLEETEV
ncbi:uncharacterized protein [Mytilus edulis]|uniref:uncharacterized protein n=1 Tax=Mytilus edulis TaxID=6550 RepID=UPI0039F13C06